MRKIILYIASSLDGYIARPNGDIDWLFDITDKEDYGYKEFYKSIDVVLVGQTTYQQSLTFEEAPFGDKETYIFSRSKTGTRDGIQFIGGDIAKFAKELKAWEGRDIWLVGGSEIIHEFMDFDLIDDYIISVHPVLLGDGIPLFKKGFPQTQLTFQESISFSSGLVQLKYAKASVIASQRPN